MFIAKLSEYVLQDFLGPAISLLMALHPGRPGKWMICEIFFLDRFVLEYVFLFNKIKFILSVLLASDFNELPVDLLFCASVASWGYVYALAAMLR